VTAAPAAAEGTAVEDSHERQHPRAAYAKLEPDGRIEEPSRQRQIRHRLGGPSATSQPRSAQAFRRAGVARRRVDRATLRQALYVRRPHQAEPTANAHRRRTSFGRRSAIARERLVHRELAARGGPEEAGTTPQAARRILTTGSSSRTRRRAARPGGFRTALDTACRGDHLGSVTLTRTEP